MKTIEIHSKRKNYKVCLYNSFNEAVLKELDSNASYAFIMDSKLNSEKEIIKNSFPLSLLIEIEGGETAKSIETYEYLSKILLENNLSKSAILVAIGGGTIGDLVGYVASTYKRGIEYINFPTTTLSMIDSSIGGKTAINLGDIKNALGTIYPPSKVIISYGVLETLDKRNYNNGLFEAIKMGVAVNKDLFNAFLKDQINIQEIIELSIFTKKQIVEEDEDDLNVRHKLNFGHTFGHAIETSEKDMLHGEAIANGMLLVSKKASFYCDLLKILERFDCPIIQNFDIESLISKILNDKKIENNTIDLVVSDEIGNSYIQKITIDELRKVVK